MKIFISYGHDRFEPVVQRIYDDLTALGYDVFKDNTETGIAISSRFDSSIDEAIEGCDFFISILSTHSVRENSVCLDEITRAREYDKGILPIRFEVVKVPLLICRYQWIDLFISEDEHGNPAYNEQDYLSVMRRIKNLLEGPALSRNVRSSEVENLFLPRPFDFSYTVASLTRNFSSRDWIDGAVHDWIVSDDFLLWMFGGAGSGKSSVISHIVSSKPGWITAVHLCQSNYTDSTRPTFVLFSLIYQLCVRLKEFRERLLGRTDAESLRTMAPNQLMHDALAVPLQKMEGEMVVLAVDGLDEMSSIDQSQFLQALAELMSCEPIRFKLILTARPEPGIMAASRNCGGRVITIDGDRSSGSANFGDCMRYAEGRLSEEGISSDDLRRIVERSDCNYLYLKYMLDDIQDNGFDAEADFPARIGGLYSSFFMKRFPPSTELFDRYEEEFVPLLEIMAAAKSTLSVEDLRSISGKGKRDVMRFQNGMSSFIRSENGSLSFYHKSLNDWMMDEEYSGEYCIDPGEGSRAILGAVRAALSSMSELSEHAYIREYAPDHLLEAKDMKSISRLLESDDEEVREHFFIRLSEHDAGTIESVLFGIGAQSDDVALNLAIRDVMFYLRYYRYVDKAHAVCDSMIAKRNQLSDLNFACVLTQKANAYHYGKEERYDLSKPLFEEAARILEESAQDPVRDYMLSMSYEGVGICYKNFGQHEKAMEYYIKAVGFTRAAYSSNPDRNTRRGLAIDCSNLGLSYSWMGDEEQSKRYYAEAHDLFRENYSKHPSFDTRRDYSVSLNRMGDLESDAGQARQYYEASMDLVKKNLDQMDSVQTNRDLARSFENLARLDERIGCMDDAISKYRQCRAILRKLLEDYPSVQNMRLYIRAVRSMLRLMKGDDAEELRSSVSEDISRAADLFPSPDMIRMRDEFNERSAFDGDYS